MTALLDLAQSYAWKIRLLELRRNAGEICIERRAQPIDHRDDRNRNAGGDQTVFNGGRAGFVFQKFSELAHL